MTDADPGGRPEGRDLARRARAAGVAAALLAALAAWVDPAPLVPFSPWSAIVLAALGLLLALAAPGRSVRWVVASTLALALAAAAASGPTLDPLPMAAALLALVHGELAHAVHRLQRLARLATPEGAGEDDVLEKAAGFRTTYLDHASRPLLVAVAVVAGAALLQGIVVLLGVPPALAESLEFRGPLALTFLVLLILGALTAIRVGRGSEA